MAMLLNGQDSDCRQTLDCKTLHKGMASDTWKHLSITLSQIAQFLPSPADKAIGLMCKLANLTCKVMEAKGKNQELVQQLSERALIVSRMIEKYVVENRPQNSDFTMYASNFHATMDDVVAFVEKSAVHQSWMDRIWNGNAEVKSKFEELWRRLEANASDYRGYLLQNFASRGFSERIDHPDLRDFWSQSMNNVLDARWTHFWEQLQHNFPGVRQSLSGPWTSTYKMKLQARAIPNYPYAKPRDAKLVGIWEINNLFQPPTKSIDQIIRDLLADEERAMVVATATAIQTVHKISIKTCTAVHCWTGYWIRGTYKAVMVVELSFAANHRISGGGSDEIGDFTCIGEYLGTQVRFVKQYMGSHQVEYDGAMSNTRGNTTTINGLWTKDRGLSRRGAFKLKKYIPNGEARILRVGEMQLWTGHYTDRGERGNVYANICFTESHKIYGNGEDDVGYFTLIGRYHQGSHLTLINITKFYERACYMGANIVYYMGAVTHSLSVGLETPKVVMEGSWGLSNNKNQGTFSLQPVGNNLMGTGDPQVVMEGSWGLSNNKNQHLLLY